jgi:hypothetical protein
MMVVMTSQRTSRRTCQGIALVAVIGLLSACGGSDDAAPVDEPASEATTAESSVEASEVGDAAESSDAEPASEPEAAPPAAPSGDANATLSLDNGESFEFSVICNLEPQVIGESEILFTATSFDDPAIDMTQFGEGPVFVADLASISVYDASFETLWEAESTYDPFGGPTELSLDGSTITGSGAFFPGGDIALAPVNGTVVANC